VGDGGGAEPGRQRGIGRQAGVQRGGQPDPRLQQGVDDMAEIVGGAVEVAVGDHQDVVRCRGQHVDQVGDLAVRPVRGGVDHERDIAVGKAPAQALDHGDGGIGTILDAEHDLIVRVVLAANRGEGGFQQRLFAAQRLQQRNLRPPGDRSRQRRPAVASHREHAGDGLADAGAGGGGGEAREQEERIDAHRFTPRRPKPRPCCAGC
jgi:hypothetical protein